MTGTSEERAAAPRAARREGLVRGAQWAAAVVTAALLVVLAIGLGWLPLCTKAAGMATLGASVVLVSGLELIRHRPRQSR